MSTGTRPGLMRPWGGGQGSLMGAWAHVPNFAGTISSKQKIRSMCLFIFWMFSALKKCQNKKKTFPGPNVGRNLALAQPGKGPGAPYGGPAPVRHGPMGALGPKMHRSDRPS